MYLPLLFLCQIEHQLDRYLQRVEIVLGKDWKTHVEGQQLKKDGDSFRLKLNTEPVYEEWKKKVLHVVQSVLIILVSLNATLVMFWWAEPQRQ